MIRSLFGRLFWSHLTVIVVSTLILGGSLSYLIRDHVIATRKVELVSKGGSAVALIAPELAAGRLPSPETLARLSELTMARVWLADQNGTILAGQPPRRWGRDFDETDTELNAMFEGSVQSWIRTDQGDPERAVVVALPVREAKTPTAMFLFTPILGINRAAQAVESLLIYALLSGMAASIVLGYFMSRSLTRPIEDISRAAARFAGGDFASRTTVTGDHEIGKLGETFNAMAASLARNEQNRRDFLANISHEIRTPIAAIQAMAEALHDKVAGPQLADRYLETIVGQTRHIDRLVQDLLDLAQLEAGELKIVTTRLALAEQLALARDRFSPLLAERGITLELPPAENRLVIADPLRLEQVLNNLLANAVRHSYPDSAIQLRTEQDGDYAVIQVVDHGEGIAAGDLPHIWDRFYRAEKSRSRASGGSGIGLAVTRQLVRAMGGEVAVESTAGRGSVFTITLPLAKDTD
ncbi:MAG: HAMP domain-containing sensor histidine kinase [Sporomusaceae bacterium]|nr:HAMP domain-containing sensor histidine kinase [Sporomusaceae bacterium]